MYDVGICCHSIFYPCKYSLKVFIPATDLHVWHNAKCDHLNGIVYNAYDFCTVLKLTNIIYIFES